MDNIKIKHLEFIQNNITRMNTNSFVIKGWCLTLISGIIALSLDKENALILLSGVPVILIFWFLDTYYLWLEKIYRRLYNVQLDKDTTDFRLDIEILKTQISFLNVFSSITILSLYLIQLSLLVGTFVIINSI